MNESVYLNNSQDHFDELHLSDSAPGCILLQLRLAGVAEALSVLAVYPRSSLCRTRLTEPPSLNRVQLSDDLIVSVLFYQLYV